uniref:Putative DNA binding, helix-turn-helix domain containing protein n=1 Tax=viral metagenome TaxID=1070528 RepID=A0A6M3LNR4_9ZZZZ
MTEERFELKRVRKELGYSQFLLAEILGVSRQYLSMMEKGRKPLNEKALMLIRDINERKSGYLPLGNPKYAKKVDKQPLKTMKLRSRFSVKMKVSDFSGIPKRTSDWERWWFREKHPRCVACLNDCKQSGYVVLTCPQFKEMEV